LLGYSQLGYRAVRLLPELACDVAAVVTHHDDPAENRWYRTPAEAARELGLPLHYSDELAAAPGEIGALAGRLAQDESHASIFGRRRPEDGRIDWSWPAARIDCLVRAVAPPWPGAFADVEGQRAWIYQGHPAGPVAADPDSGRALDRRHYTDRPDPDALRPAPGIVRRAAGRVWIATGDDWFEVEAAAGIARVPPPADPFS